MKHVRIIFVLMLTLLCSVSFAELMKITLNSSVKDIEHGAITSWVFNGGALTLTSGDSFDISDIKRIEFLGSSDPIISDTQGNESTNYYRAIVTNKQIVFTIPDGKELAIKLYTMSGKLLYEHANSGSQEGKVVIQKNQLPVASGLYTLVISDNSTLFAQKISL